MRPLPSPLLVVTDRVGAGDRLADAIRGVLAGGARWIWFRERDLPPEPRAALAGEILAIVRQHGGLFSIGGNADLAARLGADGVHLPGGAGPRAIAEAREVLPNGLIGLSAHTVEEVWNAAHAGAGYATLSPIFTSSSKPGYGPALGHAALTEAACYGMPVLALGGVTVGAIRPCREAGAAGVAVMGGLMRARDPRGAARDILEALTAI